MVASLSDSLGLAKLKFDDVVSAILNEEIRRKPSGDSLGSALNVRNKRRSSEESKVVEDQNQGASQDLQKARSSAGIVVKKDT